MKAKTKSKSQNYGLMLSKRKSLILRMVASILVVALVVILALVISSLAI